jgi:ABC-2 type transport system ATP-binding protein
MIIQVQGVSKHYAGQAALLEVDLAITAGASVGLVGLNGAGKTTLLKSLLDFCAIDQGSIRLFGLPHDDPAARARLAFLPEQFAPPYYLTGEDFLRYLAALHGHGYVRAQALDLCAQLDLAPASLRQPVRHYSKGMRQKLGLAACLLGGKELLLLDEPMSGLDPRARALSKACLRRHHEAGHSLFFSSHSLGDIEELCDQLAVLHRGKLVFFGTPQAFCEKYQGDTLEQAYLRCLEIV